MEYDMKRNELEYKQKHESYRHCWVKMKQDTVLFHSYEVQEQEKLHYVLYIFF